MLNMANEKFTLTWHSYTSHFQKVLGNLFETGESSDVTLVCDDQVKFKAHKFILKSCSPVFESILNETNDSKSVVYLRGVNQLELEPILNFIYSGQASFYQERMKDFLKIGKDLQIKEIKEVPEDNELADKGVDNTHQEMISEEGSRDDNDSVNEDEFESSSANYEASKISVSSNSSSQCTQCKSVFKHRSNMLKHVRSKHEGVKYPCNQCDFRAAKKFNLKKHIESVHEGVKYSCSHCDHKATDPSNLKKHIKSKHQ